jgi:hypothetical protein
MNSAQKKPIARRFLAIPTRRTRQKDRKAKNAFRLFPIPESPLYKNGLKALASTAQKTNRGEAER